MNYLKAQGDAQGDGAWHHRSASRVTEDRGLEYTWRGAGIGGDLDRINEFLENGQDIEERTGDLEVWVEIGM